MRIMLSKKQFLENKKQAFDAKNLSPQERSKRYKDYVLSKTMRSEAGGTKVPRAKAGVGGLSYSTMSECSKHYMHALCDPWGVKETPCVPDAITLPSYKVSFFHRGTFAVGVNGSGFITVDPYDGVAGNAAMGTKTDAGYTGVGYYPALPYVSNFSSNSPYAVSDFALGGISRRRVVAAGVKVRYIGPELTRGGRIIEYRHPNNYNAPTGSVDMLLGNRETEPVPVDRAWHYAMWKPAVPEDLAYTTAPQATLGFCLLVCVVGAPPGDNFEYDVIVHYEIVGSNVPNLTVSHNDPLGMAVLSQGLAAHQPDTTPQQNFRDVAKSVSEVAATTLSFVGPLLGIPSQAVEAGLALASLI